MKITVSTNVPASLAEVWRAYTTPEDIRDWNAASPDWHTTAAAVDLRPGGKFSSRMEARDGSMGFDFAGTYTRVEPLRLIEYRFGDREARVSFDDTGGGVAVTVIFDAETQHSEAQQREGWQAILDNFSRHVVAKQSAQPGGRTMAPQSGSFIWYELMTPDPDAAARFYGAVVGWKIAAHADPQASGQDYRHITRDDGGGAGGVLRLTPDMLAHGARPTWVGYLHVADVDAAIRDIQADGGRLLMPRMDLPVGKLAMVADPMGAPFYVMAPVPPPGRPAARSDVFDPVKPQHVRWNELSSPDPARAQAFYAKHFGFEFKDTMPMGALGDYRFIDHGGLRIGGMMQQVPHNTMYTWTFYFGVRSVAAASAAITRGGGRIVQPPHQVPGGDWVVIATDPQGALFGAVGPKGA